MFQLHKLNFSQEIMTDTGTIWRLFAFDGDVPSCFEDIPFDIDQDLMSIFDNCKSWKYLHGEVDYSNGGIKFKQNDYLSQPYASRKTQFGYEYFPDAIVDADDPDRTKELRMRSTAKALTGNTSTAYNSYLNIPKESWGTSFFEYHFDTPVTIDSFSIYQGTANAYYQSRDFKVEYMDSNSNWIECFNGNVYGHAYGSQFFLNETVTASKFRMTPISGYSTYDIRIGQFALMNSEVDRNVPDFVPTWALLVPKYYTELSVELEFKGPEDWPMILASLADPLSSDVDSLRIDKASYKPGEQVEPLSVRISNELWVSKGPDTEKPVFIAPTTIQLAATDSSGTAKDAPQIVNFFNSIDVTDNFDCHIPIENDCPDVLPMGETVVTFTATDRAGNTETHQTTITIADMTEPSITIIGDITYTLEAGTPYIDEGATAFDNVDGDVTANIVTTGVESVDENVLGIYTVDYTCTDAAGNTAVETRTITVEDASAPVITPPLGTSFDAIDAAGRPKSETDIAAWLNSATATDNLDVVVSVTNDCPDVLPLGPTLITFSATDSNGNTGIASASITIEDNTAPVVTLVGDANPTVGYNTTFVDEGATALDNVDGDITANINVSGSVNTSVLGDYTLSYEVQDAAGNSSNIVQRTVTVADVIKPEITLVGDASIGLNAGDSYIEQGATAQDDYDGDITGSIVINSNVNTSVPGNYQVTYNVADAAGNNADEVVRDITVVDADAPIITLVGDATINLNQDDPYVEQGATATDNVDGNISGNIVINSNVNTSVPGTYQVTYNVQDAAGNNALEVVRTVEVSGA